MIDSHTGNLRTRFWIVHEKLSKISSHLQNSEAATLFQQIYQVLQCPSRPDRGRFLPRRENFGENFLFFLFLPLEKMGNGDILLQFGMHISELIV